MPKRGDQNVPITTVEKRRGSSSAHAAANTARAGRRTPEGYGHDDTARWDPAGSLRTVTALLAVACGVLGLVVGSFLNVVIHRVPRKESVVAPRSRCPQCDAPLAPRDNVPVVSWLLLRGKCRRCGTSISIRYPLVELLTAGPLDRNDRVGAL